MNPFNKRPSGMGRRGRYFLTLTICLFFFSMAGLQQSQAQVIIILEPPHSNSVQVNPGLSGKQAVEFKHHASSMSTLKSGKVESDQHHVRSNASTHSQTPVSGVESMGWWEAIMAWLRKYQ